MAPLPPLDSNVLVDLKTLSTISVDHWFPSRIQKATSAPRVWCGDSDRPRQPSEVASRNKVERAWPPPLNRKFSGVLGVSIRSQLTDPELETSLAREWRTQRTGGVGEACPTRSWDGCLSLHSQPFQDNDRDKHNRQWARNDYLEHEMTSLLVFWVNLIVSRFISAIGWMKTSKCLFYLHGSISMDCLGFIQCKHKFPEKHKAMPVLVSTVLSDWLGFLTVDN